MPEGDPLATCTLPVGAVYLLTYLLAVVASLAVVGRVARTDTLNSIACPARWHAGGGRGRGPGK